MKIKHCILPILMGAVPANGSAQGWPAQYDGVMLQGFYWDSYDDSQWRTLEKKADELADYFQLVWVPQSGNCGSGQSMGYDDLYWFDNYNSSFGTEQELRSMIATFKDKGIRTIADVVINHRRNVTNWVDFPRETYKGETYEMVSTDICANDDGGKTKTWATQNGYELSKNNDTGDGWDGMRDLDHNSDNVQRIVHAYLDFLQNDLGYGGFRYDMVKGYAGRFTGIYNSQAKAEFSVGEYWDGNATAVQNWINATRVDGQIQSAAFDFPFRYTVRDAANNSDWSKLDGTSLASNASFARYAVTFVENHDTEYRSSSNQQDPIRRDTLAANAFMLAMPGTPCVFFKHWRDCKHDIAKMITLRRLAGVNNQSRVAIYQSTKDVHAHEVKGTNFNIVCVVGKEAGSYLPPNVQGYHRIAWGHHWAYWTTEPINLPEPEFPEDSFDPYDITVYVDCGSVAWNSVNFWTWGGDGSHAPSKSWPGDKADDVVTATDVFDSDGTAYSKFYYKHYRINSAADCVNFVFSTGSGSPQTVDVTGITATSWFTVLPETQDGKHLVKLVREDADGVTAPAAACIQDGIYTLDGRRVAKATRPGIYITGGKKLAVP